MCQASVSDLFRVQIFRYDELHIEVLTKSTCSEIPRFKLMADKVLPNTDKMEIAHAETKSMLKRFRPYIENASLLIVDLEGDQLGPNGIITFIQINCFHDAKCFLIDIKLIGDDELKRSDGWLR